MCDKTICCLTLILIHSGGRKAVKGKGKADSDDESEDYDSDFRAPVPSTKAQATVKTVLVAASASSGNTTTAPVSKVIKTAPVKKVPTPASISIPPIVALKQVDAPILDLKARMLLKIAATAAASSTAVSLKIPMKVPVPQKAVVVDSVDLCNSSDDETFTVRGMGALSLNSELPAPRVTKKPIVVKKSSSKSDDDDDEDDEEEDYNSEDEKPKKTKAIRKPRAVIVKNSSSVAEGDAKAQGVKRPKKAADGMLLILSILYNGSKKKLHFYNFPLQFAISHEKKIFLLFLQQSQ